MSCTTCGTKIGNNLDIVGNQSLCPSCSTGELLVPSTTKGTAGDKSCCVVSVNGKTGVIVLKISDIDLEENTFITIAQVRAALAAAAPIVYNNATGLISHGNSGAVAGTYGGATTIAEFTVDAMGHITGVTEHAVAVGGVGPNVAAIEPLNGVGYLIRTGTNTWALKAIVGTSGRVDITNGDGVAAQTQIDLATSGVAAGTYGNANTYPTFTVDAYGRITAAQTRNFPPVVVAPHTHALDDLSDVTASTPVSGQVLTWNGSTWVPNTPNASTIVFAHGVITPGANWEFCRSLQASDPAYDNVPLNKLERIDGDNQEGEVLVDAVMYIATSELPSKTNQAIYNLFIGTVPAGFRPQAEVVLPIGCTIDAAKYHDNTDSPCSGFQSLMNLTLQILPDGNMYLNARYEGTNDTTASVSTGVASLFVPIFGRYFTRVT